MKNDWKLGGSQVKYQHIANPEAGIRVPDKKIESRVEK